MKIKNKLILFTLVILSSSFFLSACKKKTTLQNPSNGKSEVESTLELSDNEKPYISLIPRQDGHELKLKIEDIPSKISQIEYELIYTASDEGLEIEKGVGDTIKEINKTIERDLLLGTSSCTNGCKYKYDEGIIGGTLTLTFSTDDNQSITYETQFSLKNSADVKKDGGLSLSTENLNIKCTTSSKSDYFIVIKNFKPVYSVFSNGSGSGKVSTITPSTVTKENLNLITGDYTIGQ